MKGRDAPTDQNDRPVGGAQCRFLRHQAVEVDDQAVGLLHGQLQFRDRLTRVSSGWVCVVALKRTHRILPDPHARRDPYFRTHCLLSFQTMVRPP